jgi:hypothetical protein
MRLGGKKLGTRTEYFLAFFFETSAENWENSLNKRLSVHQKKIMKKGIGKRRALSFAGFSRGWKKNYKKFFKKYKTL